MELWSLFEETRWKILKSISKAPSSMAEIAKRANTTVPNVSQHLRLLEAYDFIRSDKTDLKGKPGKPTKLYSLNREVLFIGLLRKGHSTRKKMDMKDPYHKMILNILTLENNENHYYLHKLLWQNEELIEKCKAISFLLSDGKKIELFIVTDHLDEIRKNFSNISLKDMDNNEKKIICWTHNEFEIDEGLKQNDAHFINLVKNSVAIHDPDNLMMRWME